MTRKSIIISLIVGLAIIGALAWVAQPAAKNSQATTNANAQLTASETRFDFGTVSMANGTIKKRIALVNAGPDPVVIEKISTSCMCTTASLVKGNEVFGPFGMPGHGYIPKINQAIEPNEEAGIEVTFDPAAHGPSGIGRVDRSVSIENNAGSPLEIQFTATVAP